MMDIRELKNMISNMVKPLRNRVYTMITRAIIETVKDDDGMQIVKLNLLAGESRDDVERFQNFGFSSNPPVDSECVVIAPGGNRDHLIVIVADDRKTRIKDLAKGESVFYNAAGDKLILKANGDLDGELSNDFKMKIGNNVDFEITKNFELDLKKFKVKNDTGELIDLLTQMLTAIAAEPFIVNKGTFSAINVKLLTFKVV